MKHVSLALLCALRMCGHPVYAEAPVGLTLDPEISAWFRTLQNPVTGKVCCDTADGHVLKDSEWRIVGDRYEVKIDGAFVQVPEDSVLQQIPNPTGSVVAFWLPGGHDVRCFVRGTET